MNRNQSIGFLIGIEGLDIDAMILNDPPDGIKFPRPEFAKYIISLVLKLFIYDVKQKKAHKRRSKKSNCKICSTINADKLKDIIDNYRPYVNWLIKYKILKVHKSYSNGAYSKQYEIIIPFEKLKVELITNTTLQRKLGVLKCAVPEHIEKWFNDKLKLDVEHANIINDENYEKGSVDHLRNQITIQLTSLGYYHIGRDRRGFRINSFLTSLPKKLRHAVRYNGKSLMGLDVKSSQPFLISSLLLNPKYYEVPEPLFPEGSNIPAKAVALITALCLVLFVSIFSLTDMSVTNTSFLSVTIVSLLWSVPNEIHKGVLSLFNVIYNYPLYSFTCDNNIVTPLTHTISSSYGDNDGDSHTYVSEKKIIRNAIRKGNILKKEILRLLEEPDVLQFKDTVINKDIYDFIADKAALTRDEAKEVFMQVFYSQLQRDRKRNYTIKHEQELYELFPNVFRIMEIFKEWSPLFPWHREDKFHAALPVMLQFIEANMIIDTACHRINERYPDLPILTIHDNILTTKGNEVKVKEIMEEVILEMTGVVPTIRPEDYS